MQPLGNAHPKGKSDNKHDNSNPNTGQHHNALSIPHEALRFEPKTHRLKLKYTTIYHHATGGWTMRLNKAGVSHLVHQPSRRIYLPAGRWCTRWVHHTAHLSRWRGPFRLEMTAVRWPLLLPASLLCSCPQHGPSVSTNTVKQTSRYLGEIYVFMYTSEDLYK